MRVTIKDIAEYLNINKSTVSYALNGKGTVKEKTRELVRRTAREMGYVPNQYARQTSTGKSNEVAIVVPKVISIYGEFCEHAFQILSEAGMNSSINLSEFSVEREDIIIKNLIGRGVAGVLIVSSDDFLTNEKSTGGYRLLQKHNVPTIIRADSDNDLCVSIDFRGIGRMMGEKLREAGKKKICIASSHPPPFFNNITETMAGIKEVIGSDADIRIEYMEEEEREETALDYSYVIRQTLSQSWYDYHRCLFHKIYDDEARRPDAIVSPTESCLMGIMNETIACGVRVPEDIALISGTKDINSLIYPYQITSVFIPEERIASEMVKQLLNRIHHHEPVKNIRLKPEFFPGETL